MALHLLLPGLMTSRAPQKRAGESCAPCRESTTEKPEIVTDPVESAKAAGLRYVSDQTAGIRRKKVGKNFSYTGPDGKPIRDEKTLARIRSLGIPPAYRDVWICTLANGHLQATGYDARGRKQYRYHPRWRAQRDETKYTRMMAFGAALPHIRERTKRDLAKQGMPREKVLATIVQLLEKTLIRVGNEEYTRQNKSYGLTTMRNQHVSVEGSHTTFHFKGKSGVRHTIDLHDRRLSRVIEKLHELPGQDLFQYVDAEGAMHTIGSADVNAYLKEISGEDFTAKDFRTWAGTVLASMALQEFENFDSETQAKTNIVRAIETVSQKLGNTPSVCRKCYVHPAVLDCYLDGSLLETLQQRAARAMNDELANLQPEEAAVMTLLRQRLEQARVDKSAKSTTE
ncbi:MAG TPA: DNA topoisomerase IB [Abditibacteriaceae bacterium]|jgi:DNA topoisomerase-1